METLYRLISGLTAGFIALFAPIGPLVACAMAFIGIDFLSGVAASRAAARRKGHTWYFESCEAWRTVLKLGLTVTAIAMALVGGLLISVFGILLTLSNPSSFPADAGSHTLFPLLIK